MMKFEEFKILAKGMKAVYTSPNFLPDADALKIWYQLLKDLPYEIANMAIQRHMATNKFPPTIADIREQASLSTDKELNGDWGEAWQNVTKAIGKYGQWETEKALESLDDLTRQCVKRLGWKELCMSENAMADRANFRMIYEEQKGRAKEQAVLPLEVKANIEKLQNNMKFLGGRKH